MTRPLCAYPAPDAVYRGGDPNRGSSYTCLDQVRPTNAWTVGGHGS